VPSIIDALDFATTGSDNNQSCRGKKTAGSTGRRIPRCFVREKFDSFFLGQMLAREETPTSPMYFTQSFRGSGNNFYYLGILRIESREKKNEDRARQGRGSSTEYTVEDSSREQRGRGLDSSCTVNNTPPGRDRLAHPRHPATIYLLFVPHTFVSWPPLPSMVPGVFTAAETRGETRRALLFRRSFTFVK